MNGSRTQGGDIFVDQNNGVWGEAWCPGKEACMGCIVGVLFMRVVVWSPDPTIKKFGK